MDGIEKLIKKHTPTKRQTQAFNKVVKVMNEAKKKGLFFYGKQWSLVAYTGEAEEWIYENDWGLNNSGEQVPHLSEKILRDSGADDFASYKSYK